MKGNHGQVPSHLARRPGGMSSSEFQWSRDLCSARIQEVHGFRVQVTHSLGPDLEAVLCGLEECRRDMVRRGSSDPPIQISTLHGEKIRKVMCWRWLAFLFFFLQLSEFSLCLVLLSSELDMISKPRLLSAVSGSMEEKNHRSERQGPMVLLQEVEGRPVPGMLKLQKSRRVHEIRSTVTMSIGKTSEITSHGKVRN